MKCRVCGKDANVELKAYNLALCNEDFLSFFEKRVLTTIKKYELIKDNERSIVAVSGGKDSLSLWFILNRLGIPSDGFHIHLGIDGYSDRSLLKVREMAKRLGRMVYIFYLKETFREGIKELSKKMKRKPCSLCGTLKRYIMNRICMEKNYDVIVLGHNLDDEASALLGNLLYWKKEYLWKKGIVLPGIEGHLAKKVKPLFFCHEKELASYAIIRKIDYITEECPFSVNANTLFYKELLNMVESRSPGTKLRFLKGYLDQAKIEEKEKKFCNLCGYPSYTEKCLVCRMLERFDLSKEIRFEIFQ